MVVLNSIGTLMVANRGEIALRVFRSASAMGLRTVAVFTELDAAAPHVRAADVAVRVPSYLDIDAVVRAARDAEADAVHPGYGFLSERAEFARALEAAGIRLVGPSADVMDAMGRKDHARRIAVRAGVPVVPSYDVPGGADLVATPLREQDFPVLVKAAAGGGGKGMRVVRHPDELSDAMAAAAREARSAFGDDTLLIEKYVESGRHVEVQVIADDHGHVLHLFERDCSSQRRHQKVLEEAPGPTVTPALRERLTRAAVDLAAEVGYRNAGTVEFLLDNASGDFYFLEMNTRLQVEHPVTEAITGVDLVREQLLVADGQPLSIRQDSLVVDGHAIEARIYAEDSFGGFLPQAGKATAVHWPSAARVDQALESGQVVSTSYDPMLGKVIAHAADRTAAVDALVAALDDTAIFGLTTNAGFVRELADSTEFRDATIDTSWLDHHDVPRPSDDPAGLLANAALAADLAAAPPGAWRPDGFRMGGPAHVSRVVDAPTGSGRSEVRDLGDIREVSVDGVRGFVRVGARGPEVVVHGQRYDLTRPDPFDGHGHDAGEGELVAPMPGTVLAVNVAEGETVTRGQTLVVVEAMKMELALKAPYDGVVSHLGVALGAAVALGEVLVEVTQDA